VRRNITIYHQEDGTEALITNLSKGIQTICLSELAVLEFRSAVWKKTRTGEIDTVIVKQVIAGFQRDLVKFQWIPLESGLLWQASDLLMKYAP
jgi:predicted nucleic acid-binding protein